jgi:hypothetical protein
VVTDREHRISERGGPGPAEPHSFVTGHVDDQAARSEGGKIVCLQIGQRIIGVLQSAVDHDVALGQEGCERHPATLGDDLAQEGRFVVVIKLDDIH